MAAIDNLIYINNRLKPNDSEVILLHMVLLEIGLKW